MNTMIFESWLEENARLEQERVKFWKNVQFHILCAGAGVLFLGVLYVIVWIGTALND